MSLEEERLNSHRPYRSDRTCPVQHHRGGIEQVRSLQIRRSERAMKERGKKKEAGGKLKHIYESGF
jgi:hypothetical protein